MRPELREALSALADGEVADPALVAEALEQPDAVTLVVTLAEARVSLRDTSSEPGASFDVKVEAAMAAASPRTMAVVRRIAPVLYAGLGLTAGVLVGVLLVPAGPVPAPIVVQQAAPASVSTLPAPQSAAVAPMAPVRPLPGPPLLEPRAALAAPRRPTPPQPRTVYRFEVGRNWREGS